MEHRLRRVRKRKITNNKRVMAATKKRCGTLCFHGNLIFQLRCSRNISVVYKHSANFSTRISDPQHGSLRLLLHLTHVGMPLCISNELCLQNGLPLALGMMLSDGISGPTSAGTQWRSKER
ncbi:hypothetical protein CBL_12425 [Carabus blaptoides fortunei]